MINYCLYRRVSTVRQGQSGLGLEAQEHAIEQYLTRHPGEVIGRFMEVETGKNDARPELAKAIALCREHDATLLIAKLDRLSRRASLVFNLRDSGVKFIACDMPDANELTIGIMCVISQWEVGQISTRIKEALAAAKRRGVRLGNPRPSSSLARGRETQARMASEWRERVAPVVEDMRKAGVESLGGIARCLNVRGIKTVTGKQFFAQTVKGLMP